MNSDRISIKEEVDLTFLVPSVRRRSDVPPISCRRVTDLSGRRSPGNNNDKRVNVTERICQCSEIGIGGSPQMNP